MRYAVYITRADHWSFEASECLPISEAEWSTYAGTDAELRTLLSLPCFNARTRKEVGQVPVEKMSEWIALFEYNRGGIIVRALDPELLRKAVTVADTLGARVFGEDEQVIGDAAAG